MSTEQPDPGRANQNQENDQPAGALPGTDASAPAPADAGGDANPCNTASHSYGGEQGQGEEGEREEQKPDRPKILRVGMDSLYLSFQGEILPAVEQELGDKKHLAQSRRKEDQALAQYLVKGHLFEVRPGRERLFPYVLEDGAYRISLASGESRKLPFAYVKVSSDLLAHKGAEAALNELTAILDELAGQYELSPTISRMDIFADFQTGVDLGKLDREAWVTRADGVDSYSRKGRFSGWVIGTGGEISARLYDKTLEIAQKNHKPYLLDLWARAGRNPELPVWRLEFQLRREVLVQLGIRSFKSLLDYQGGIWGYATQNWLRLAEPQKGDSNRGRWPTHPLWAELAEIRWRLDDVPLERKYSPARPPSEERLLQLPMACLTSFMAVHGLTDYQAGLKAFLGRFEVFHRARCEKKLNATMEEFVELEAHAKGRRFNTLRTVPEPEEEIKTPDEVDRDDIDDSEAAGEE
jgi:hypothetical protein